jgi:hypothetical protein
MLGEPPYRTTHLRNDAIEPGRRRQRIFDDREIDPKRKQALGEEGEILLVVHLLATAARARRKSRRCRMDVKYSTWPQITPALRNRKFADSPLEGDGFEPSVPR